jgi:NADPH:quinone reductase-like Zn-dependent oxidoreductase
MRPGPRRSSRSCRSPTPEPGAGEIRIRVKAIGRNRAEINFRAATYAPPPAFPAQLGLETSGEIDAVGSGVTGLGFGEAVSVIASPESRRGFPSNVSPTLTTISSQTSSSGKSSSPFSVLAGAVSNHDDMYIPAWCMLNKPTSAE